VVDVNGRFEEDGMGRGEGIEIGMGLKEEYNFVEEDEEVVDLPFPLTVGVLLVFVSAFEAGFVDVGALLLMVVLLVLADLTIVIVIRYTLCSEEWT
jgi:hypothetical protein